MDSAPFFCSAKHFATVLIPHFIAIPLVFLMDGFGKLTNGWSGGGAGYFERIVAFEYSPLFILLSMGGFFVGVGFAIFLLKNLDWISAADERRVIASGDPTIPIRTAA